MTLIPEGEHYYSLKPGKTQCSTRVACLVTLIGRVLEGFRKSFARVTCYTGGSNIGKTMNTQYMAGLADPRPNPIFQLPK